jgi:hypothetical protein
MIRRIDISAIARALTSLARAMIIMWFVENMRSSTVSSFSKRLDFGT